MAAKKKAASEPVVEAVPVGDRVAALSVRADGTPDQIAPVLIDEDAALVAASAAIGEKAAAKLVASVRAGA